MGVAKSALTYFAFGKKKRKIGLQLYSIRDVIFKDVNGTLKQVADFGYQELEAFSYNDGKVFGKPVSEVAKMDSDLGMKMPSGHYGTGLVGQPDKPAVVGTLANQWEKAVSDAKILGQANIVIAYLQQTHGKT